MFDRALIGHLFIIVQLVHDVQCESHHSPRNSGPNSNSGRTTEQCTLTHDELSGNTIAKKLAASNCDEFELINRRFCDMFNRGYTEVCRNTRKGRTFSRTECIRLAVNDLYGINAVFKTTDGFLSGMTPCYLIRGIWVDSSIDTFIREFHDGAISNDTKLNKPSKWEYISRREFYDIEANNCELYNRGWFGVAHITNQYTKRISIGVHFNPSTIWGIFNGLRTVVYDIEHIRITKLCVHSNGRWV